MAKRGRPFAYESDAEKPVTVSLRIPRDVYEQAKRYVGMRHPMTLTDLLLDGLRLRLDTPADPRDIILSDYNTVIQELQEMIQAAVQAEIGKLSDFMGPHFKPAELIPAPESPAEPIRGSHLGEAATHVEDSSNYDNTVLQEDGDAAVRATAGGQPARPDRAALVARLHEMRARGMSLKAIVDQLRSEGLPTISGKGQWQKGTVDKLLHSQVKSQGQPA